MLVKLLKYDLKYMIKNMSVFYILAIFFAITTRLLNNIDQSVIVGIIAKISLGTMVAMLFNILLNTMIRSWIRFRDSLYKDESYLTHTLPVTKNDLYNSKFLQALIFFFVGFLFIIASLFITFYSKENWVVITNYIRKITIGLNMKTAFFVTIMLFIIFLEVFNAIQCGFLGITLGHRKNNGKVGYSVLFGFIIYLLAQSIILGLTFAYGLFNPTIMALFTTVHASPDADAFKLLAVMSAVLYMFIIFIMYLLCKAVLNKGVNVE